MTSPRFPSVDTDGKVRLKHLPAHTHPATDLSDASSVGRAVVTATDAAAARAAIGVGAPTIADLPAGTTLTVLKSGGTWPTRPTARTDVIVAWKGADPSPTIGTGGMLDGVDYRLVTP